MCSLTLCVNDFVKLCLKSLLKSCARNRVIYSMCVIWEIKWLNVAPVQFARLKFLVPQINRKINFFFKK